MTLRQKQSKFTKDIGLLIAYAYEKGYELTFADAYRNPRVFGEIGESRGYGRASSNHKIRLAVDLNLFRDGKWLTATEDHRQLGDYWESLNPDNVWGGRFQDGNHYSVKHNGQR